MVNIVYMELHRAAVSTRVDTWHFTSHCQGAVYASTQVLTDTLWCPSAILMFFRAACLSGHSGHCLKIGWVCQSQHLTVCSRSFCTSHSCTCCVRCEFRHCAFLLHALAERLLLETNGRHCSTASDMSSVAVAAYGGWRGTSLCLQRARASLSGCLLYSDCKGGRVLWLSNSS